MKTQKFLMALAAIAALSMSSCTQEEELLVSNNNSFDDPNAVLFGTYTGQAPHSRGAVLDNTSIKGTGFGVYGYYTGTADFAIDGTNAVEPNFMCNQEVTWAETLGTDEKPAEGSWTYSPVKYWPNTPDEKVSFVAYAPYVAKAVASGDGITSLPTNTTKGDPKLGYSLPSDPSKQLDLLYSGGMLDLVKQNVEQKVQFNFEHAMTKIGFERVIEVDEVNKDLDTNYDQEENPIYPLDKDTKVVIKSVSLTSADFYKSGTLNLRTGDWEYLNPEAQTYTLKTGDFTSAGETATEENSKKREQLNTSDKYMMIFPTEEAIPVEITVTFDVITTDDNLNGKESKITSQVTTPFEFKFVKGRWYNFVLHIGLTSVKLDAELKVWDHTWDDNISDKDAEVVINTPANNVVTLVYDANGGEFNNGSSKYIVTASAGNWKDDDDDAIGHNPKTEAMFKIPEFQKSQGFVDEDETPGESEKNNIIREIKWIPDGTGRNYEFQGWTYDKTEHQKMTEYEKEILNTGTVIFVQKTDTSSSLTIYAFWPAGEHAG